MSDDPARGTVRAPLRRFVVTGAKPLARASGVRRVLNAGSGPASSSRLHSIFAGWTEVRLDLDPKTKPDLVGSIRDMRAIVPDRSFEAIWASHNLEHLYSHEVHASLLEFRRILTDDGFAFVTSPDLEAVARFLLAKGLTATAYESAAGPITPLDMLFGHIRSVAEGNNFMSHKTGFTVASLGRAANDAGFAEARIAAGQAFDLWGLLLMPRTNKTVVADLLRSTPQRFLLET